MRIQVLLPALAFVLACGDTQVTQPPLQTEPALGTATATQTSLTTNAVTLVGTGDPAIDFPALQAAVGAGGTVNLQGQFALGSDNVVEITNSVEIVGEPPIESGTPNPVTGNRERSWPTVITGGGGFNSAAFYSNQEVDIVIQNLHFDRYQYAAIWIRKAGYAEVGNCLITNGFPEVLPVLPIYDAVMGMIIGGAPAVNGGVDFASVDLAVIQDNVVSIVDDPTHHYPPAPPYVLSSGISLSGMPDGERIVRRNHVKNFAHLGILNPTGGKTEIISNLVTAGDPGDGIGQRLGIAPDWYSRVYYAEDVPLGQVYVRDNVIESHGTPGVFPRANGIVVNNSRGEPVPDDSEVIIENNEMTVDWPPTGRGIVVSGLARNVTVRGNTIRGDLAYGIIFNSGSDSEIVANRISVTATEAGMTFWAHGNPLFGGASRNIVARNVLEGSGQIGIVVGDDPGWENSEGNSFLANDLQGFDSDYGIQTRHHSIGNRFVGNTIGSASGWGIHAEGTSDEFINNRFIGQYEGFGTYPDVFVILEVGSQGNLVVAVKDETSPNGFDLCGRVLDLNLSVSPFTTTNEVPGLERCSAPGAEVVAFVQERLADVTKEKGDLIGQEGGEVHF
jgi:hypothetical protein